MKKRGLPNYQVETYSKRKICKTSFILSTQMLCMIFIAKMKNLRHYSLNMKKKMIIFLLQFTLVQAWAVSELNEAHDLPRQVRK